MRSRSFRREGHTNAPQAPFSTSPGTGEGGGVWITFAGSCSDDLLMVLVGGSWGDVALSPGGVTRITGGMTPVSPPGANLSEGGDNLSGGGRRD